MTTHTDPRRICARAAAICLLASAFLLLPGRASAQWATNGNDINTTNTGNVGVGTTAPASKLDVKGATSDAAASAVNVRNSTDASLFFVRNDGRVGFNTASPLAFFHVAKGDPTTGGAAFFQRDTSSAGVAIGTTSSLGFLSGANSTYTASADLLINPFGGNVGIGTTAPAYKLDVVGYARFSGNGAGISLNNANGWTQFVAARTGSSQAAFIAVPSVAYGAGSPYWAMGLSPDGSAGWSLDTWDGTNMTTRMRMLPGGDLGIGTASPSAARLHIYSPANTYLRIGAPLASQSSIAFNDDTNGQDIVLYRPETTRDFVVWTAAAGNVMRVMQSGVVGIGTNSPGYKFDVQGGQVNASGGLCIAGDCKTAWSQVGGTSQWTTSGSNVYFNTGNVGIGVTNPASNLQIGTQTSSPTAAPSSLSLGATYSSTAGANFKLKLYDDGTAANTYGLGVSNASMDFGVSSTAGYNWYSGGTHKMALTGSGSLGLGTAAPERRLHVLGGSIESQWSTTAGQGYGFFIARDNNHIVENAYYNGTEWRAIKAGKAAIFQTYTGGGYAFYIQADDTSRAAEAARSFSPIFVVKTDGKVGMGTTTPGAAYKLDVVGSVNSSGLCLAGDCKTAWSQVGGGSQWTTSGANVYYSAGNVGIGTTSPRGALEVGGGPLFLGDMGNAAWGNMVVRGRVISASNNIHLSPPGGTSVYINSDYREAGGAAGPVNLNVSGDVTVGGNINAKYQDVAEWVPSTQKLSAGTVVVLDKSASNHVVSSSRPYDTKVAGVISDSPGVILGVGGEGKLKVATTGRVKVRVDASRGAIEVGDLLVTSEVEGVAMKSVPVDLGGTPIHRPGTIIGKALEPLEKGVGEILVLLSLQ